MDDRPFDDRQRDDVQPLIACEHCAGVHRRRALQHGELAACERCGTVLWRYSRLTLNDWLALAVASLIVFCVANAFPVARIEIYGAERGATLLDAIGITWQQHHWAVAFMTGMVGFMLPLLQLLALLWVLLPLSRGRMPADMAQVCRLLGWLQPWSMVPVFLLGVIVALVKLASSVQVHVGLGLPAFGVLTVLLTIVGRLSPQALWRHAEDAGLAHTPEPQCKPGHLLAGCHACGLVQDLAEPVSDADDRAQHCMRCHAVLHKRKPQSLARTWALMLTAAILYIPANILPVMRIATVVGDSGHTILGGVVELWRGGAWDIALIVFVASVVVPMTKLLALLLLVLRVQWGDATGLRARTRMYEMVEIIGQWSMLDVFVVILLSALADFPGLMRISADTGAAAFGLVVVLTMLAAMSFDPRSAWDAEPAAGASAHLKESH
ncbi:paraquat-inducible protein A [Bordetella sp. FB-8]|uniref:paraquat-inducible protein A n=1 Tax=Bordetella sp. FB-8 TaxID=1159870 RepID=UPI00035CA46B|nr:paraquat-inducible protein A [Bordetella sp. FB-8]